jgi:hypothetical protein
MAQRRPLVLDGVVETLTVVFQPVGICVRGVDLPEGVPGGLDDFAAFELGCP